MSNPTPIHERSASMARQVAANVRRLVESLGNEYWREQIAECHAERLAAPRDDFHARGVKPEAAPCPQITGYLRPVPLDILCRGFEHEPDSKAPTLSMAEKHALLAAFHDAAYPNSAICEEGDDHGYWYMVARIRNHNYRFTDETVEEINAIMHDVATHAKAAKQRDGEQQINEVLLQVLENTA